VELESEEVKGFLTTFLRRKFISTSDELLAVSATLVVAVSIKIKNRVKIVINLDGCLNRDIKLYWYIIIPLVYFKLN